MTEVVELSAADVEAAADDLAQLVQIVRAPAGNGSHRAEIQRFAVRADVRGRGVGRLLLEAATERARELGITWSSDNR